MIPIIGLIVIGFVIGYGICLKEFGQYGLTFLDFMFAFLGGLLGVIIGGMVGVIISIICSAISPIESKRELVDTYNLETISDNSRTTGSFFIGSGVIEGKMSYAFYYRPDKAFDTFRMDYVDCDRADIKYDNGTPRYEKYSNFPVYANNFQKYFCLDNTQPNVRYIFYVPKGTITNSFKLDAQ